MAVGLAVADSGGMYLAIKSQALARPGRATRRRALCSKLIELQSDPCVYALVAGGLDHWTHVADLYSRQLGVRPAVDEVLRLLDECMTPPDQVFGLACGHKAGEAVCYRVNGRLGEGRAGGVWRTCASSSR